MALLFYLDKYYFMIVRLREGWTDIKVQLALFFDLLPVLC